MRINDLIWRRRLAAATFACVLAALFPAFEAAAQADPQYRGLWVGGAKLTFVSEVTVPLDENNVAIAPNPAVPTPTADTAHLRLILHVDGAGQTSLLKDVAVLSAAEGLGIDPAAAQNLNSSAIIDLQRAIAVTESDLALVTDPRLYGDFPPQPAIRIASAAFDFGDSRASQVLSSILAEIAAAVRESIQTSPTLELESELGRRAAENAARQDAVAAAAPLVAGADVASTFRDFLVGSLGRSAVTAIATGGTVDLGAIEAAAADVLAASGVYQDTRAIDLVGQLKQIGAGSGSPAERQRAAQHLASAFADVTGLYSAFLVSETFGEMIPAAAQAAAAAAEDGGASLAQIQDAVDGDPTVRAAESAAQDARVTVPPYEDARSLDAVAMVVAAVVSEAFALRGGTAEDIAEAALIAGRDALNADVPRYRAPPQLPTLDYNAFVTSAVFTGAPAAAAQEAAQAGVFEKANNPLHTDASIEGAALVAAINASDTALNAAAGASRTELPMAGAFGLGSGDPALTYELAGGALGPAGLEATIFLPASHPTNPFRHRRHPDHRTGLDVMRRIRLDFDADGGTGPGRAGFGVDRVTGTYREEIFGLHKPVGQNQDRGLLVEGRFELSRISRIDALNGR